MNIFELLGYTYLTDRELMQQALEALEEGLTSKEWRELVTALRERLAQPEQEPVNQEMHLLRRAWDALDTFKQAYPENWHDEDEQVLKDLMRADLRLSGVQLKWVGLTEGERVAIAEACGAMDAGWLVFVEAIERALKEKNNG